MYHVVYNICYIYNHTTLAIEVKWQILAHLCAALFLRGCTGNTSRTPTNHRSKGWQEMRGFGHQLVCETPLPNYTKRNSCIFVGFSHYKTLSGQLPAKQSALFCPAVAVAHQTRCRSITSAIKDRYCCSCSRTRFSGPAIEITNGRPLCSCRATFATAEAPANTPEWTTDTSSSRV